MCLSNLDRAARYRNGAAAFYLHHGRCLFRHRTAFQLHGAVRFQGHHLAGLHLEIVGRQLYGAAFTRHIQLDRIADLDRQPAFGLQRDAALSFHAGNNDGILIILVLDGDLEYTKLYAGSAAQFSLKLKNEGTEEYVGVLAIYAQSPSLGNGYFLREGIVVKPGEVLDLTKSTRIGCPAGTYTMRVLYDRDRTGVLYDLTNSQSVDVKNPTDVTLRLLDDVAPVNAEIERGDELEINVNIKSEGGVYYNRLLAFVFDEDKNNVFTFYRDVFLEEDEETNVVLSSVLNLEPGKYEVDIWGLKPTNNNEYLRPTGGSHICNFTVFGSGVDEVADAVSVYPNPAVDVVNVENAGGIDRITIYSLEGRLCMDVVAGGEKSTDISVAGLPSGTYILKVENQDGVFTDKLIKK